MARIQILSDLTRKLSDVISEAALDITRLVEAFRHQRFDGVLCGGSSERSNAGIPPRPKLHVGRQAGVDEPLNVGYRPFVELSDSGRQRFDERIELRVG